MATATSAASNASSASTQTSVTSSTASSPACPSWPASEGLGTSDDDGKPDSIGNPFWRVHGAGTVAVDEADPPTSLREAVGRAEFVVEGKIIAAEVVEPRGADPTRIRGGARTLVTVASANGRQYKFGLARAPSADCILSQVALPDQTYFFLFATPAGRQPPGATASCFDMACVVGAAAPRGATRVLGSDPSELRDMWTDTGGLRGTDAIRAYIEQSLRG
ncbi:hypothetical protein ABLG96_08150 [Nakamurella sp. A5-74]|uniref:Uncharacterized protein n=1 Tax=Nakamurella sp. A5-74 TaxID=3158264 RepID=A0AAU8DSQ8_9ACTN